MKRINNNQYKKKISSNSRLFNYRNPVVQKNENRAESAGNANKSANFQSISHNKTANTTKLIQKQKPERIGTARDVNVNRINHTRDSNWANIKSSSCVNTAKLSSHNS